VATGAITRVRLGRYRFPFRAPWPSVDGPQSHREGIVLVLEDDDGRIGVGESAPYPGFGMESLGSSLSALRLAARFALGMPAEAFLPAAADLARLAPVVASPGARTAIDFALHDLTAQRAGVSVARLLGGEAARPGAYANAALPRGTLAETETAARAAVDAGARCVKLKVGGAPIAEDVARVRAARLAIGADARLRVDANQAWREDEAIEALRAMEPFRLEYAEQPLPAGAIDAHRQGGGELRRGQVPRESEVEARNPRHRDLHAGHDFRPEAGDDSRAQVGGELQSARRRAVVVHGHASPRSHVEFSRSPDEPGNPANQGLPRGEGRLV
jgi:L-alanine-DL-glutamate epimerase-like enolase superfamily enzyme